MHRLPLAAIRMTGLMNVWTGVLVATCIFMSATVLGSTDSTRTSPSYGISFGIHIDYEIGGRNTSEGVTFDVSAKTGYSIGAVIRLNLRNNFSLETGIRWTALGVKNRYSYQRRQIEGTCSSCPPTYLLASEFKTNGYLFYLAIPIKPTYSFGKNDWKYSLSAGPIFNIRLGYNYEQLQVFEDGTILDYSNNDSYLYKGEVIDAMDFGFSLSFVFERELNNGLFLQISPEWEIYSLISLNLKNSWRKHTSSGIKIVITKR